MSNFTALKQIDNKPINTLCQSLDTVGFADYRRIVALMGKTTHGAKLLTCPNDECNCSDSIQKMHAEEFSNKMCRYARYCVIRIQGLYNSRDQDNAEEDTIVDVMRKEIPVKLNINTPHLSQFKRHCGLMVRLDYDNRQALFIDNRPWLDHLRKYGVDIKVSYHQLPTTGISVNGLNVTMGLNLFTGECIDASGRRFRLSQP